MNQKGITNTTAARYDKALSRGCKLSPVPVGCPQPQPTTAWPVENVDLLARYHTWLEALGAATSTIEQHRIPMAGHVLGLNIKPHLELNLDTDLEKAMVYILAKERSQIWTRNCRHSLTWFRRFLRLERGLDVAAEVPTYGNAERYKKGLPTWLLGHLEQLLHLRQANWRPSRRAVATYQFWHNYTQLWRWLLAHEQMAAQADICHITRRRLFTYIDEKLAAGYAVTTVNQFLRAFQASLHFIREQGFAVPQALLRLSGLKEPDSLPRFLTDEQVCLVQEDLEKRVRQAKTPGKIRNTLLDRAAFYLLWQGGLRLGEVEDLCLEDLNLAQQMLIVRRGKGVKDRAVYLTESAVTTLQAYLERRGPGKTESVFLHRGQPLCKDLIRDRIKAAGKRTGVKVTPHMLRHTFATQLLNAGCRITTIQALLGHKHLNTTMIYARVHDHTVAEDYYTAMAVVEKRLAPYLNRPQNKLIFSGQQTAMDANTPQQLLKLVDVLEAGPLAGDQRALLAELRGGIVGLTSVQLADPTPLEQVVNVLPTMPSRAGVRLSP